MGGQAGNACSAVERAICESLKVSQTRSEGFVKKGIYGSDATFLRGTLRRGAPTRQKGWFDILGSL